jgi:hypothetical protein
MASSKNSLGTLDSLKKGFIKRTIWLFKEYELVKLREHERFKTATAFFAAYSLTKSNFFKLYNRYKQSEADEALLPRKRGPKYVSRRIPKAVESEAIKLRKEGLNRYDICRILSEKYKYSPCLTSVYNMFKKHELNKRKTKAAKGARRIMTERLGELGHIDCHYLPKNMIAGEGRKFLVGVVDDASRLMWATLTPDLTSARVSFGTMRCLHMLRERYGIIFERMMSDNGAEFGSGRNAKNKKTNIFEVMLEEMGVKHSYIKPYHPQTNGKIERIWKTMDEELIDADWDSWEQFEVELLKYILYYNEHRIHQSLGKTPAQQKMLTCSRIT